ncbi:MAG: AAA family ATPase, partial [Bacteroidetes bacterium]|nr:AAA family ATPase [Bacteroidota bacterium]
QVAERLNVHVNTVLRFIKDGKLPAARVGKEYRIKERVLLAFIGDGPAPHTGALVIAVANQKGGATKTTTSVNLAASLGKEGKKTLLVDLDPQGGCAVSLGLDTSELNLTIYDVLVKRDLDISKIIMETDYRFELAPSNIDLAGAEVELMQILSREGILKRRMESIRNSYDYIIIDCPPSLGILTVNALTAADTVLIPVACEYMALRGLKMLFDTISNVRAATNPNLNITGILATKYDARTLNSREILEYLQALCKRENIRMFEPVVNSSVRFIESPRYAKPLVNMHPELDGAKAYQLVAQEIING